MKAALIILALIVVVGLLAWLLDKIFYRRLMVKEGGSCDEEATAAEEEETECCGMHAVCEKDLLSPVSDEYEYYDDEELDAFLFSLGCYPGEPITVISQRRGGCTVSIKDGRYSIDKHLAEAIVINE